MTCRRYRETAIRVAAVQGVLAALPNATDSEIARALGIGRDSVWRHRHGKTKIDPRNTPKWSDQFLRACAFLAADQPSIAAVEFEQLAGMLKTRDAAK